MDFEIYIYGTRDVAKQKQDSFGKALKRYADDIGIGSVQISELVGISKTSVNYYFNDERRIGFNTLIAIYIALRLHTSRTQYLLKLNNFKLCEHDQRYYILNEYTSGCAYNKKFNLKNSILNLSYEQGGIMMGKYRYIRFKGVPKNIEREYNKMCRKEQYLEERDWLNGFVHIGTDAFLLNVPEPYNETESESQKLWEKRLKILHVALDLLKFNYPFEYGIINKYYFSEPSLSISNIAEKYKLHQKQVDYRLKKARELLKNYIIMNENSI